MDDFDLIIGYEPTPQGEDALVLGEVFSNLLSVKPLIATVLPWWDEVIDADDIGRALEASAGEVFAPIGDRLKALRAQTRALADPSAGKALHRLAEDENAALIVVGSCRRGTAGRILLGSVGESLLHGAPCAVAVAPHGYAATRPDPPRRIGVAFDGSPEAWAALETAIGIARGLGGSLTVLAALELETYGYASALGMLSSGALHTHQREAKRRLLELAVGRAPLLSTHSRLLTGPPGAALADATEELDMIVCGSRGYGPFRRTMLGSTAAGLMRRSSCPVLVLPRAAGLDPLGLDSRASGTVDAGRGLSVAAG